VLRVLKQDSELTFFLTVSIIDRYLAAKQKQGVCVEKDDLHLLGLTAVFISIKFEELWPISLDELIVKAGHSKYTKSDLIAKEKEILLSLGFKVQNKNIYEESF
jgi:cyclin B